MKDLIETNSNQSDWQKWKRKKRRIVGIKSAMGVYREEVFDEKKKRWIFTGSYCAIKQERIEGKIVRRKKTFKTVQEARFYRQGIEDSCDYKNTEAGINPPPYYHPNHRGPNLPQKLITFAELVEEWKAFHFLTIEASSSMQYEKKLIPIMLFLKDYPVAHIDTQVIDTMVRFWVKEYPRTKGRHSFEKELDCLVVVLNFYRKRKDRSYVVPVEREHILASTIIRKGKGEVQALSPEELALFLAELEKHSNKAYLPLALAMFGLSLRVGEAVALTPQAFDFENESVRIAQTVVWNEDTWEWKIKPYPKNKHIRTLALPDSLKRVIQEWIALEGSAPKTHFLFHKDGEPLCRKTIGAAFNQVLKRIGITSVSGTHFLRKTSATLANDITGDFYAVSKQLDHSSLEITKRYVRPLTSQKRKVASALEGVFKQIMKP